MTAGRRLPLLAGGVLFAYLLGWMVRLALLESGPDTFDRTTDWAGSLPARLVLCAVLLAAVYHTLDGSRLLVGALLDGPGPRRPADRRAAGVAWGEGPVARAVVRFGVWALVIPGWVVLLRPWLEGPLR